MGCSLCFARCRIRAWCSLVSLAGGCVLGVDWLTMAQYVACRIETLALLSRGVVDAPRQRAVFDKIVSHLRELYKVAQSDYAAESIRRLKKLVLEFDAARVINADDGEFKAGHFYFIDDQLEEVTDASRGLEIRGGCYRSADLKDAAWRVHASTVHKIQVVVAEISEEKLPAPSQLMAGIISEVRSIVFLRYCDRVTSCGRTPGKLISSTKKLRITHCFACKSALDSRLQLECSECGWIVCQCGACECSKVI